MASLQGWKVKSTEALCCALQDDAGRFAVAEDEQWPAHNRAWQESNCGGYVDYYNAAGYDQLGIREGGLVASASDAWPEEAALLPGQMGTGNRYCNAWAWQGSSCGDIPTYSRAGGSVCCWLLPHSTRTFRHAAAPSPADLGRMHVSMRRPSPLARGCTGPLKRLQDAVDVVCCL